MGRCDRPPLGSAPSAQRAFPPLPFAAPDQPDAELQAFLEQASARLCHWLGSAASRPPLPGLSVMPPVEPQSRGLGIDQLLADLDLVMDGAYNPGHPGALAHLDPPPLAASIVGDLICAGLNNNLLAEELSPSLSRLERSLMAWLAERIGLPAGSGGVPASGGTLSNLMALVIANLNNVALGGTAFVVLYVNRRFLPPPLRPGWLPSLGLVACGVFYLGLAALVFVAKQWPVLKGLIGL